MATYYIDPVNGDNTNTGLSWSAPFKTITKAASMTPAVDSIFYVGSGVCREGNISFGNNLSWMRLRIIGSADTTVDASGYDYAFSFGYVTSGAYTGPDSMSIMNFTITGFEKSAIRHVAGYNWVISHMINCKVYNRGTKYQTTNLMTATGSNASYISISNSTIYGLDMSSNVGISIYICARNCIFYRNKNYYAPITEASGVEYNASEYSTYRGTGGIDTTAYPPPFISDSSTAPNLSFDSTKTNFIKYMTSSYSGSIVGSRLPSIYWSSNDNNGAPSYCLLNSFTQQNLVGAQNIFGAWSNDELYYNTSFKPVVIDSTSNKIDLRDSSGGSIKTAVLSDGTYISGTSLATAVKSALDASSSATHTVTYLSSALKLKIESNGSHFDLPWATGTNALTSAGSKLGFTTDSTGNIQYTSQNNLCVGYVNEAPSDAGAVSYNSAIKSLSTDKLLTINKKHGRAITQVIDTRSNIRLKYINVHKYLFGSGNTTPLQARAHSSLFAADASSGTTDLDWSTVDENTYYTNTEKFRYWQFRMTINLE